MVVYGAQYISVIDLNRLFSCYCQQHTCLSGWRLDLWRLIKVCSFDDRRHVKVTCVS